MAHTKTRRGLLLAGLAALAFAVPATGAHAEDYGGPVVRPKPKPKVKKKVLVLVNHSTYQAHYWLGWKAIHRVKKTDSYGQVTWVKQTVTHVEGAGHLAAGEHKVLKHVPTAKVLVHAEVKIGEAWKPVVLGHKSATLPVAHHRGLKYKVIPQKPRGVRFAPPLPTGVKSKTVPFSEHNIHAWEPVTVAINWDGPAPTPHGHEHEPAPTPHHTPGGVILADPVADTPMPVAWEKTPVKHVYRGVNKDEIVKLVHVLKPKGWRPTDFKGHNGETTATYDITLIKKTGPEWAASPKVEPANWSKVESHWKQRGFKLSRAGAYKVATKTFRWALWEAAR